MVLDSSTETQLGWDDDGRLEKSFPQPPACLESVGFGD